MKVSIITICYNAVDHIDETIRSVVIQDYKEIEHIVIDGGSRDGTQTKIKRYEDVIAYYSSEPDQGIYHAMNKGLAQATGEIVGFVNSGDMIAHRDAVKEMVYQFQKDDAEAIYGDAYMVDQHDIRKVKRFWKGEEYDRKQFKQGWMPPHLGTYIRRSVYDRLGDFNTEFKIAADYELMFRFMYVNKIKVRYYPKVLVRFRLGGLSNNSLRQILKANLEVYKAWELNGEKVSPLIVLKKPLRKIKQLLPGR